MSTMVPRPRSGQQFTVGDLFKLHNVPVKEAHKYYGPVGKGMVREYIEINGLPPRRKTRRYNGAEAKGFVYTEEDLHLFEKVCAGLGIRLER